MKDLEHIEQVRLTLWAQQNTDRYPALAYLFAIPNGGYRHPATARRMKAEGVKAGVPDLMLLYPSMGYSGLIIEMKAAGGRVTPEQNDWLAWLCKQGFKARVCWSFEEARDLIVYYLEGKRVE